MAKRIRKPIECVKCGQVRGHAAKGLCVNCYSLLDYKKHKDKRVEKHNEWVESNRDKVRAYNRESHYKFHEKNLLRSKKYREENYEEIKIRNLPYRRSDKHRELKRLASSRRRANLLKISHAFTYDEWCLKLRESCGVCPACKEFVGEENLTLDHIIPISEVEEGYIYTIDDVQPLCRSCNCSKGAKPMEVFQRKITTK